MKHKKAIMLDFLVTVILALVIFVPAILIVNKACSYSDQAKKSFNELTDLLHDFPNDKSSEQMILKMDSDTAIAYFEPGADQINIFIQGIGKLEFFDSQSMYQEVLVKRPPQCTVGKSCLCLIQDSESEFRALPDLARNHCTDKDCQLTRIQGETVITPTKARCTETGALRPSSPRCSVGAPVNAQGYFCRD